MGKNIKLMTEENIDAASASLARAFMKDPLQSYTFPDEEERRQRSQAHFRAVLQYGWMFGEVYISENTEGAAVYLRPGETEGTPEQAKAAGLTQLPALMGEDAAQRFFSCLDYIEPFHKEDMPEPHWYVMVIGVDPSAQGKGLGQALLAPVLEMAREKKHPVYLETAQPTNVSFYEKIGFRVLRELIEPVSGLKIWTFRMD